MAVVRAACSVSSRAAPRSLLEELGVARDVGAVLGGHVVIEVDRGDRAFCDAGAAVDALVRIDVELDAGRLVRAQLVDRQRADDAVARTDVDARRVTRPDALLG